MSAIKIFEDKKVRSQYDATNEIWFFSITNIVAILTDSKGSFSLLAKAKRTPQKRRK